MNWKDCFDFSDAGLRAAGDEMREWDVTGVLRDGVIKESARKFMIFSRAAVCNVDQAAKLYRYEIVDRWIAGTLPSFKE